MKYCSHCGKEINDAAVLCIHCGCSVATNNAPPSVSSSRSDDKANVGLIILCVLFPIVGLILWAIMHDDSPKAAHTYGKAALITFLVSIGLTILIYFIFVATIVAII